MEGIFRNSSLVYRNLHKQFRFLDVNLVGQDDTDLAMGTSTLLTSKKKQCKLFDLKIEVIQVIN